MSRSVVQAHSRVGAAHRPVLAPFLVAALLSSPQLTQQQGEPAGVAARRVRPEKRCSVQYSDDTVVDDRLTDTLACLFFLFFFKKKGKFKHATPQSTATTQPPRSLVETLEELFRLRVLLGSACCSAQLLLAALSTSGSCSCGACRRPDGGLERGARRDEDRRSEQTGPGVRWDGTRWMTLLMRVTLRLRLLKSSVSRAAPRGCRESAHARPKPLSHVGKYTIDACHDWRYNASRFSLGAN